MFPRKIVGGDTPVDRPRYVFLGSDNFTGLTVNGLRFTHVKLTDRRTAVSLFLTAPIILLTSYIQAVGYYMLAEPSL